MLYKIYNAQYCDEILGVDRRDEHMILQSK
jgi:hypothetical protein